MDRIKGPGHVNNLFVAEDVATMRPPTEITQEWLNGIQEELIGLILLANLVPSDNDRTQIVQALIQKGMQAGYFNTAADTGAANVYQVAYTPAITSLTDQMVLKFKAKTSNNGASTFTPNPGNIPSAPIWGGDHAALTGGEIVANGSCWVQWNSTLNGGNGAWLLIKSTGGYNKSPNPPQFDNSQKLVTSAFLTAFGIQASGATLATATGNVALSSIGGTILGGASSAITQTMPTLESVPIGGRVEFFNAGTANMTVANNGGNGNAIAVNGGARISSLVLGPGDSLVLEKVHAAYWAAKSGSVTQPYSSMAGVGFGQSWNDYTASRALNTTYTNTTSKPIMVAVMAINTVTNSTVGLSLTVGGITSIGYTTRISGNAGADVLSAIAIVPPGATYSAVATQASLNKWAELR